MRTWALIPVKAKHTAKSRLSGCLSPAQRSKLCCTMLEDVLDGLDQSKLLTGVALYGPDPEIAAVAARRNLLFLGQTNDVAGLNASVADGVRRLACFGAEIIAVLASDLPYLKGDELDHSLAEIIANRGCAVIPDRLRNGTNGLVFPAVTPPTFCFGPDSFARHLSASDTDLPRRVFTLPSFADDIDSPDDLTRLARVTGRTGGLRAHAFAQALNVWAPELSRKEILP